MEYRGCEKNTRVFNVLLCWVVVILCHPSWSFLTIQAIYTLNHIAEGSTYAWSTKTPWNLVRWRRHRRGPVVHINLLLQHDWCWSIYGRIMYLNFIPPSRPYMASLWNKIQWSRNTRSIPPRKTLKMVEVFRGDPWLAICSDLKPARLQRLQRPPLIAPGDIRLGVAVRHRGGRSGQATGDHPAVTWLLKNVVKSCQKNVKQCQTCRVKMAHNDVKLQKVGLKLLRPENWNEARPKATEVTEAPGPATSPKPTLHRPGRHRNATRNLTRRGSTRLLRNETLKDRKSSEALRIWVWGNDGGIGLAYLKKRWWNLEVEFLGMLSWIILGFPQKT